MSCAKDYLNPLIFMGRKLLSEAKIKVGKMAIFDHKVEILPFKTIKKKRCFYSEKCTNHSFNKQLQ